MDKVYCVKIIGKDAYLQVGSSVPLATDKPEIDPMVAKFTRKEDAFAAMTNWINPIDCEIVSFFYKSEYDFEVVKKETGSDNRYNRWVLNDETPILHTHLYLRLLRESLRMSIRDVAAATGRSAWSITMFENDESFELDDVDVYSTLVNFYKSQLIDHPHGEIIKAVAKTRLIQYYEEGWFEVLAKEKHGLLRRNKKCTT
jgi:hypothetical protein